MKHSGTKRIETERLILRQFREEDAEPMFRNWASDPEVTKYLTWPVHKSAEVSERIVNSWIKGYEALDNYQWAIELKEIHEPIGSISAVKTDDRTESVTVGYCIGRSWWGQGITAEALRAVIAFFFSEVGMKCVNACHDPRNPNSGKVMRKCGMTYEGTWRAGGVNNQGVCDESWYSVLKQEYESAAKENTFAIRNERPDDYRRVEEIHRKAFWNLSVPGCDEHYLAHILRGHEDFMPELDYVYELGGEIVANVMYTKSKLVDEEGNVQNILTFGPVSVAPEFQRRGIGKELLEKTFKEAVKMGYKAIAIFGNPDNYVARGFKSCKKYNVCLKGDIFPASLLVKELEQGFFDGRKYYFSESAAYEINNRDAEAFDRSFEPRKKAFRPSQEEFYIHSHAVIR